MTDTRLLACLVDVDRADFAPLQAHARSATDAATAVAAVYDATTSLPIGAGATLSSPLSQARALQALAPFFRSDGVRVLDVGSGSGFSSTVLARMAGERGHTVGIDHANELVKQARTNVMRSHADLLHTGRLELHGADAREGWLKRAPFDVIHIGLALEERTVLGLVQQLAANGALLVPLVSTAGQTLTLFATDSRGLLSRTSLGSCQYAPLRAVPPPAGSDSLDEHRAETDRLAYEMGVIAQRIQDWQRQRTGKVSLAAIQSDEAMSSELHRYHTLKRAVDVRRRREAAAAAD